MPRGAVGDDELRMQFAAIAAKVGMPEEKVAMMAQMVRQNGMADSQMGFMMQTACAKGVDREEIMGMLTSLGVQKSQVVRVMPAQGLMDAEEATRILDAERAAAERRAATRAGDARKRFARKAAIIAFWLVVWEVLDHVVDNRLVLAGPIRTLQALAGQVVMPNFWMIVGASFGRIALGFLLSFVVGIPAGAGGVPRAPVPRLRRPHHQPAAHHPRGVVHHLCCSSGWATRRSPCSWRSSSCCRSSTRTWSPASKASTSRCSRWRACAGLSRWRTFLYAYRPAFMPFLLSSTKISLGMTWKSGIMAEVLATPKPSIGKEMATARTFLDTPDLLAWTVVVMVASVLFEKAFMALLKRANRPLGGLIGKRGE